MKVRKQNINKKETTIVSILLDKSGSMDPNRKATVEAINEYVGNLKNDKNKYKFNLTFFDTELEKPYVNVDIKNVGKLTEDLYRPDGMTALYDAVYQTANDIEKQNSEDKVLFVIMTDGLENSSHEHDQKQISLLIKRLQEKGWTFVFMGANQDSWATAQTWNIPVMNITNFNATEKGIHKSYEVLRGATMMYASSSAGGSNGSSSNFFNKDEQEELQNQR